MAHRELGAHFKRQFLALALPLFCVASAIHTGCSSGGNGSSSGYGTSSSDGGSTSSGTCKYKDPGTQFAPCAKDSDCFSGFCDTTGKPGPYCFVPTRTARSAGHGYDCSSDKECADVARDVVNRGATAQCRNDQVYAGCLVSCPQ